MRVGWVVGVIVAALYAGAASAKGDIRVRIIMPEAKLYKSADYNGKVVRTVKAGEAFVSVSDYKGFYLVVDEASGNFLYVPAESVEVLGEVATKKILVSGQMAAPTAKDLSYWQIVHNDQVEYTEGGSQSKMRTRSKDGYSTAP